MKLLISRQSLLDGLQRIQNIIATRVTLPLLSNVLLETTEKGLSLTATDLEVSIRTKVPLLEIDRQGSTTLPARRLLAIIRELPYDEITLETDARHITSIRSGASFFKIFGIAQDEFPAFPQLEEKRTFSIKQSELLSALKKTAYAISNDESRYILNGILFSFKEGAFTLVATDGRRLALCDAELGEMRYPTDYEGDFVIPTKAIQELLRLLNPEEEMRILLGENLIAFDLGNTLLATKLLDGKYPNYRQVIPNEVNQRIVVERELLLQSARRVALLSNAKKASLCLQFSENNLNITTNTPEIGEAEESLSITYQGPSFKIGFHPDFLMDPLKNLSEDSISLEFIDEMSPGVIKINSAQRFLYVLMPIDVSRPN